MPAVVHGWEIVIRLLLSAITGGLIGLDRTERGRPVGVRTTMLVCIAAAASMVQADILLSTNGKTPGSFAVADVLRLPLGILSGMGFIGAGAILRREDIVLGVTTAATLWFVTVMGLCFGGGQLGLGAGCFLLGILTLMGLRRIEDRVPRDQQATLELRLEPGPVESEVRAALAAAGLHIAATTVTENAERRCRDVVWAIRWHGRISPDVPAVVESFAGRAGIQRLTWRAHGLSPESAGT
jgi:putative Mg2+ transporter-C (MgtC) family protein